MKKMFLAAMLVAGMAATVSAQTVKQDVKKAGNDVKSAANDVADKSSEVAVKGYSAVVDKKYAGKMGPNGETIYIDKKSHYYYVTKKGKRIYIKESELRNKPIQ